MNSVNISKADACLLLDILNDIKARRLPDTEDVNEALRALTRAGSRTWATLKKETEV